jgi:SAM-dependent methyltransferase
MNILKNIIKRLVKKFKLKIASKAIQKWQYLFLQGNNVECPVCTKAFITFLPAGNPVRFNAKCPKCSSLERTRLIWLYLLNTTNFFLESKRILHVGPENSLFQNFTTNRKFQYYPIDKFTEGYSYSVGTIDMDLTSLKFDNNFFDFILCSHVLEHIQDDRKAMQEMFRVLKPGGFGIILVPINLAILETFEDNTIISPEERKKHFGQFDHVRYYGLDIKGRLEQIGFNVKMENAFCDIYSSTEQIRYGLTKDDLIINVSK